MRRPVHTADKGWLVVAQNTADVDYAAHAYTLALSIHATQTDNNVCLVTDQATFDTLTDKQRAIFYHIALLDNASDNAFENDWQIWGLSPFKETIKVEADVIIPCNMQHVWSYLRNRDVAVALSAADYKGNVATTDKYRKFYAANNLPDVYNGLVYWRYTRASADFFMLLKHLTANWSTVVEQYKYMPNTLTTDTLYAVAVQIFGVDRATLPDWRWAHFKPAILGLAETANWNETLLASWSNEGFFVGGYRQTLPVHYYIKDKNFLEQAQEYYERKLAESTG